MRFALKVYYAGKRFYGSQIQPNKRTVEGELLKALRNFGLDVREFQGASRTDRGVSALGNVYAFKAQRKPIPRALNSFLPDDIRVLAVLRVDKDFHPRRCALEKVYKYFLIDRGYDAEALFRAAKVFEGTHSFHNYSRGMSRDPIRKLRRIKIHREEEVLVLTFTGESFLWEMVRRLVSALRLAGEGKATIKELEDSLVKRSTRKYPPSPPDPLVLWRVKYDFDFIDEEYSKEWLRKEVLERMERHRVLASMDKAILRGLEIR
jgi:tRNA pseudouridine38-40 synthase